VSLAAVRASTFPVTGGVVKVPQASGTITLSAGGVVVLTKTITAGQITPADNIERALLLGAIPGATL
jgi:hypothetical protein